jgi:hypothetical protein
MPLKEQFLQAIEALPSTSLAEALALIHTLTTKPRITTARTLLAHLKTIGTWSGDDLQDCLSAVKNSRGEAQEGLIDFAANAESDAATQELLAIPGLLERIKQNEATPKDQYVSWKSLRSDQ